MAIKPLSPHLLLPTADPAAVAQPIGGDSSFQNKMKEAIGQVNQLQLKASAEAEQLALGLQDYLHSPMIAYEKANLALQLTIEIRNRLVESYQEIMRMQM